MKALTLWQPWASLISLGVKRIETRGWGTHYRGQIAIHAAKKWDTAIKDKCREAKMYLERLRFDDQGDREIRFKDMPVHFPSPLLGCVLCTADLVDCRLMTSSPDRIEDDWGCFGVGRYGWSLENVKPLHEPVFCRGAQGFWNWDHDESKETS